MIIWGQFTSIIHLNSFTYQSKIKSRASTSTIARGRCCFFMYNKLFPKDRYTAIATFLENKRNKHLHVRS